MKYFFEEGFIQMLGYKVEKLLIYFIQYIVKKQILTIS